MAWSYTSRAWIDPPLAEPASESGLRSPKAVSGVPWTRATPRRMTIPCWRATPHRMTIPYWRATPRRTTIPYWRAPPRRMTLPNWRAPLSRPYSCAPPSRWMRPQRPSKPRPYWCSRQPATQACCLKPPSAPASTRRRSKRFATMARHSTTLGFPRSKPGGKRWATSTR